MVGIIVVAVCFLLLGMLALWMFREEEPNPLLQPIPEQPVVNKPIECDYCECECECEGECERVEVCFPLTHAIGGEGN